MTVIELIERASARLEGAGVSFGHGTTNAFDEAAWLVLWRLGLPLHALDEVADRPATPTEQAAAEALVEERITSRRPAAYLTGEAWLQGVPFFVDERVIVPRSLIAELIADGTLDAWLPAATRQVLDMCTGNGSLAVLAALAWPDVAGAGRRPSAPTRWRWHASTSIATAWPAASRWHRGTAGRGAGPLRPRAVQPALRQPRLDGGAAGRVPRRAGIGPGRRRRRRHGLRPPPARRRAGPPEPWRRAGAGDRPRACPFRGRLSAPARGLAAHQRR